MADSEAKKQWMRKNTVQATVKLNKRTDADIIQYFGEKIPAATIKDALREYIKNHSSATQPAAEEKKQPDYSWLFEDEEN